MFPGISKPGKSLRAVVVRGSALARECANTFAVVRSRRTVLFGRCFLHFSALHRDSSQRSGAAYLTEAVTVTFPSMETSTRKQVQLLKVVEVL